VIRWVLDKTYAWAEFLFRAAILSFVLALLTGVPTGLAGSARPELGVYGNEPHFHAASGQESTIRQLFVTFGTTKWLQQRLAAYRPVPMLALETGSHGRPETATPRGIALGYEDAVLFQINAVVAGWPGSRFYLRPFPEMNAHWKDSCAYNGDGRLRDAAHSVVWNRKAFARVAVLVRGCPRTEIDGRLARLGLPGIDRDLPVTTPKLRLVWNSQGFGAPDVPGNSAEAYYPGDAYVDVVGDDLYDQNGRPTWPWAEKLYQAHANKPFAFPEWGLWGIDDPAFVRAMVAWVQTHPRTEFISYYSGRPGSVFDLATKPRSQAAYRKLIVPLGSSTR
jgi:Glycosyl hydrolase family 26